MNLDPALALAIDRVEHQLLQRPLSPIERRILERSWYGQTYTEMAQDSIYGSGYIKAVGSQLWAQLSTALGVRVTKKNLRLTLVAELHHRTDPNPGILELRDQRWSVAQGQLPVPGVPLPLDSPFYIERPPIEQSAYAALDTPGCALRLRAPSKMGTSSLLARVLARAAVLGYVTVEIDCQEAEIATLGSLSRFLRWVCATVSRYLNLSVDLNEYWDEELGSKVSCKLYFESFIRQQLDAPLVIAFTELHRLFEFPHVASEFLGMLRFWHEQAQRSPLWQQLRCILSYATDNDAPLDLAESPFNIGISLRLPPFTPDQVTLLAERYQLVWDARATGQLMQMVGGHPYLVSLAFYHLRSNDVRLDELLATAATPAGIYSYHLRGYLTILREQLSLAIALRQAIDSENQQPLDAIAAHRLESLGLIELVGERARITCQLYQHYFSAQLAETEPASYGIALVATESIDIVTQLPNHAVLRQYLQDSWLAWLNSSQAIAILLAGVDRFELYNAARGRATGDSCLRRLTLLLHRIVPDAAILARYDGAQFAVVVKAIPATALAIAEQMRASCVALNLTYDRTDAERARIDELLTLSVGVACWLPPALISPPQLLATAETALYEAKHKGGNCALLVQPQPDGE
ncbi:MAG: diguanylate cyclase [Spirulinaceae cyanobacterium RM2_2_10]|nr:diguanylate cyclase [Spirulinaceae cyanobacterium SM2_1_0]NJO21491.1 diguanylate cyclase [Spirulinaceae cyanobacterium RM2_2_10]